MIVKKKNCLRRNLCNKKISKVDVNIEVDTVNGEREINHKENPVDK